MADEELITDTGAVDPPPAPATGGDSEPPQLSESPPPRSVREELLAARDQVEKPVDDRPRDASGKFLPKAADAPRAPVETKSAPTEAKPATAPGQPSTAAPVPSGPPPGWAPEAKAEWAKLPPAIQTAVIKREGEVSAGFQQYQGLKQRAEEYERVLAPRRQYYAGEGISDHQAIDNMWQWYEALATRNPEAWQTLARQFGFDLSTVISADPGSDPQQIPIHPAIAQELQHLRAQVGQIGGTIEQQNTARASAHLADFAKDHPHYDRVRVDMGHYISRLPPGTQVTQAVLQDAYDRCIWASPEIRQELTAAEVAKATAAAATSAIRTPPNPRRAAVSLRGGAPNGAGQPKPAAGSVREMLKAGFAEQRGG